MKPAAKLTHGVTTGALLVGLSIALTSCGGSDEAQENPASAAEAFYHAIGDKDFETACTLVTDESGETLTSESPDFDQCVSFMDRYLLAEVDSSNLEWLRSVEVNQATVDGDSATVSDDDVSPKPPSSQAVDDTKLSRVDGKWYVELD